jgi:hypothetical protein
LKIEFDNYIFLIKEHTFNVLEANDDQVFLSVSHNEDLPKVTNIYVSGGKDISEFTVSLLNNVRS